MAYQIKNRCTTAITVNLDGMNRTIPAGELSGIFSKMVNTPELLTLARTGLLVLIDIALPSPNPVANEYTLTSTEGDVIFEDLPEIPDGVVTISSQSEVKENKNSITDKESGG